MKPSIQYRFVGAVLSVELLSFRSPPPNSQPHGTTETQTDRPHAKHRPYSHATRVIFGYGAYHPDAGQFYAAILIWGRLSGRPGLHKPAARLSPTSLDIPVGTARIVADFLSRSRAPQSPRRGRQPTSIGTRGEMKRYGSDVGGDLGFLKSKMTQLKTFTRGVILRPYPPSVIISPRFSENLRPLTV